MFLKYLRTNWYISIKMLHMHMCEHFYVEFAILTLFIWVIVFQIIFEREKKTVKKETLIFATMNV